MNRTRNKFIKYFLLYLGASLLIGVPSALLNGVWPKNITGWIIIFVCGFPSLVFGESLSEKFFNDRISHKLDPTKKDKVISVRRMGYALIVGIAVTALVFLIGCLLRDYFIFL